MSDYNKLLNVINALGAQIHADKEKVVASINIIMANSLESLDLFDALDKQIERMAILNGKEKVLSELLENINKDRDGLNS